MSYIQQPGSSGAGSVTSINGDTTAAQTLSVGTSGTDFAISDAGGGSHVFNLPSASATARGVITTGTQTIAGAKTYTGVASFSAGSVSAPSVIWGDSATGFYRPGANRVAFSGNGAILAEWGTSGILVYDPAGSTHSIQISASSQGYQFNGPTTAGTGYVTIATNSSDGGANYIFGNSNVSTGWTWYILGSGDEKNNASWRSSTTGNFPATFGAFDTISFGNTQESAAQSQTVQIIQLPDQSNVGGTVTPSGATFAGTSTKFNVRLAPGDRVSTSAASSTYATCKTIASNTSATLDATLTGTGATWNIKHAAFGIAASDLSSYFLLVNDQGRVLIGDVKTVGGPLCALHVSSGAILGTRVTLSDTASVTVDCSLGNVFELSATQNTTMTFTNATAGTKIVVFYKATSAPRTLSFDSTAAFGSDITALTATASGKTDAIGLVFNSSPVAKLCVVGYSKGF